ncbi:mucin-22-like isoform X2 [Channa argus]|uniref:mucin-22-like isoform X2 n=1 Tax=Channa argus TaxID=215402 RepID=UPI003521181B
MMTGLRWNKSSFFLMLLLHFTAVTGQYVSFTVKDGEDVTLPCNNVKNNQDKCSGTTWSLSASRTSQLDLILYGKISENAKVRSDRLSLTENCSLVIKKVTDEDGGLYMCQQSGSGTDQVYLSVVTMTEHQVSNTVTLSCSVTPRPECRHTVKWLFEGKDEEKQNLQLRTSQSNCSATVTFLTSSTEKSKSEKLFKCEVTEIHSSQVQQFTFNHQTSGDGAKEATTSTAGKQPPTTSTAGKQPPTTSTAGKQPPTTSTEGKQPPTTSTAGKQPPTTSTAGKQPPTTSTAEKQPPTTSTAGKQPPTTSTEGKQPPTTSTAGKQPPTTSTAGKQPPTTSTAGKQPPTTSTAGKQPPTTSTAGKQPPTTSTASPGWWGFSIVALVLAVAAVMIIRWKKTKVTKTQVDENTTDAGDGVSYATVSFTKKTNSEAQGYANDGDDEGEAVTYSKLKAPSSCAGASTDPNMLYATVIKHDK